MIRYFARRNFSLYGVAACLDRHFIFDVFDLLSDILDDDIQAQSQERRVGIEG